MTMYETDITVRKVNVGYILTVMRPNEPVKTLTAENHKKMQLALKHEFDRDEFHPQADGVLRRKQ